MRKRIKKFTFGRIEGKWWDIRCPRIFPSSSPGAIFSILSSFPFHFHFPIFPFQIQKKRREERGRRRRRYFFIYLPNFFHEREKMNRMDAEGELFLFFLRRKRGRTRSKEYKKDLIHPKMNKVFSFFIPISLLFYP